MLDLCTIIYEQKWQKQIKFFHFKVWFCIRWKVPFLFFFFFDPIPEVCLWINWNSCQSNFKKNPIN